jgi:hypothetical protein
VLIFGSTIVHIINLKFRQKYLKIRLLGIPMTTTEGDEIVTFGGKFNKNVFIGLATVAEVHARQVPRR